MTQKLHIIGIVSSGAPLGLLASGSDVVLSSSSIAVPGVQKFAGVPLLLQQGMRGSIRRLFGCSSAPQEAWVPDFDNPLPDSFFHGSSWSSSRQKALERQLTTASGAVTVIGRDSAALVNVFCDRDYSEQPAAGPSRPQSAQHRETFRRLESIPNRGKRLSSSAALVASVVVEAAAAHSSDCHASDVIHASDVGLL